MTDTIVVTEVVKRYGSLTAVDDVSLTVGRGEFFGILGPNGAGKTTLLEIIEGLREADSGTVTVLGEPVWPRNPALLQELGVQLVLFVGISMLPFLGLQLNRAWYVAVPLVIAGTLAFLAVGLLVGAVAKTAEGGSGLANLIILPMAFLSGDPARVRGRDHRDRDKGLPVGYRLIARCGRATQQATVRRSRRPRGGPW